MIASASSWTPHSEANYGHAPGFGPQYPPTMSQHFNPNWAGAPSHRLPHSEGYAGFRGYCNTPEIVQPQGPPSYQNVYYPPNSQVRAQFHPTSSQPVWNHQGPIVKFTANSIPIHQKQTQSTYPVSAKTSEFFQRQALMEDSLSRSNCTAFPSNQASISPETGVGQKDTRTVTPKQNSKLSVKQKKVQSKKICKETPTKAVEKAAEKKSNRGRKPSDEPLEVRKSRKRVVNRISQRNSRAKKQKLIEDLETANEILQKADFEKNWALHQKDTALHHMGCTLQEKDQQLLEKDERIQWLEAELNRLLMQGNEQKMEHASLMSEAQALEREFNDYNNGYIQQPINRPEEPVFNQVYHV